MKHEGRFVKANGIDIYYETYGDGPPLVLLHGAFGNINLQWKDHIDTYAEHFRVFGVDARAHGKTRNPSGILTSNLLVEDVLALIHALQLEHPFISGWSMGGFTTLSLAVHHPDVTRGVVIGGASHKVGDEQERMGWMKKMGILGPGKVDFEIYQREFNLYDLVKAEYGEYFETLIENISHMAFDRPTEYTPTELQATEVPILLLMGDRDYATTVEDITELYRLLPNAELAIIPGADHSMCRMKPQLYSQLVVDFLKRQLESQ